ncbi:ASCH domain-containing protein [Phocaeicola fibrisolvens]|uniref:ASCH domain-containing protein n=1 Tax=Phocaeicola fibrisolvens TaxID=2981793 RepID=UPI00082327A8|nr:ASCH domain-containing protein [Phocaeicola fibrisolvens]MCU6777351.1 ASCH domain-containing protein [Phocaeicola fibrisolvens]SCH29361.1 ASCH domain [uncultured Bacteroides sp.]
MKAISIKQPWASLIAHGIKDIENRTWKCPQKYIGQRVLIHASLNDGFGRILNEQQIFKLYIQKFGLDCNKLPHGAIIGSVVISDCVQDHPSVWAEKGCYNWVLKDAVLFDKPIEGVKGKLGFWNYNLEEK